MTKKLIIAGSRHLTAEVIFFNNFYPWWKVNGFRYSELVTGCCSSGADQLPFLLSDIQDITITPFPADWATHGRAAGPIRNEQMAQYADELLVIWDGKSRGTQNMIYNMKQLDKPVHEIVI